MRVWVCNHCHAEIPQENKPTECPLCRQHLKGFDEGERPEPTDEDKKYTAIYQKTLKELEKYDEGCDPTPLNFCCDE